MYNFDGSTGGGAGRVDLSGRHGRKGGRSGAEESRSDFVKRQHRERQAREEKRLREKAATSIQAAFRAYRCVQPWKDAQRQVFDKRYADITKLSAVLPPDKKAKFVFHALLPMLRQFVFFFARSQDAARLAHMVELVSFSAVQEPGCNILRLLLAAEERQQRGFLAIFERLLKAMLCAGMAGDVTRLLLNMHSTLFAGPPDYLPVDPVKSALAVGHVLRFTNVLDALTREVLPAALQGAATSNLEPARLILLCCAGLQVCDERPRQEGLARLLSTPGLDSFLASAGASDCLRRLLLCLPAPPAQGDCDEFLAEELQGQLGQAPRCVWLASNLLVVLERCTQVILGDSPHGLQVWLAWLCWAKAGPVRAAREILAKELGRLNRSSFVRELMQAIDTRGPEALLSVCQLYFSADAPGSGGGTGEPSAEVVQTFAFATPFTSRLFPTLASLLEATTASQMLAMVGAPSFSTALALQLRAFCVVYALQMQPMYDCEFFGEANALQLSQVQALALFLNNFAYRLIDAYPDKGSMAPAGRCLRSAATSLLSALYNRHCRRTILPGSRPWVILDSRCLLRGSPVVDLSSGSADDPAAPAPAQEMEDDPMGVEAPGAAASVSGSAASAAAAVGAFGGRTGPRGAPQAEQALEAILDEMPHVLPFEDRVALLHNVIAADQRQHRESSLQRTFMAFAPNGRHQIRRDHIVEDGFAAFESLPEEGGHLRDVFRVTFVASDGSAERGVDGGGLFKEFMVLVCRSMFDPEYGLFSTTSEQTLYPAVDALRSHNRALELYSFLGKVVGKAIYEMILLEPQFSRVFLNRLLGRTNELDDVAALDKELHRNMLHLRESSNIEDLQLTFSVTTTAAGHHEEIDLIPDGRNIPVTKENLTRYFHLLANFKTNVQLQRHTAAFLRGLQCVIPASWFKMFDPYELNILVSGSTVGFDVMDLKRHTVYAGGYQEDSPVIEWLWQLLLHHTDPEDMGRFLMFATSCSRAPLLGFKTLHPPFCIHRVPSCDRLPTASTCSNLLKLPEYDNPETLRAKITQAIQAAVGFELS